MTGFAFFFFSNMANFESSRGFINSGSASCVQARPKCQTAVEVTVLLPTSFLLLVSVFVILTSHFPLLTSYFPLYHATAYLYRVNNSAYSIFYFLLSTYTTHYWPGILFTPHLQLLKECSCP